MQAITTVSPVLNDATPTPSDESEGYTRVEALILRRRLNAAPNPEAKAKIIKQFSSRPRSQAFDIAAHDYVDGRIVFHIRPLPLVAEEEAVILSAEEVSCIRRRIQAVAESAETDEAFGQAKTEILAEFYERHSK